MSFDPTLLAQHEDKLTALLKSVGVSNADFMSLAEKSNQLQLLRTASSGSASSQEEENGEHSDDSCSSDEQDVPRTTTSTNAKPTTGMKTRAFKGARIKKGTSVKDAVNNDNGRPDGQSYIAEDEAFAGAFIEEGCDITHNCNNNNLNYNPPPPMMPNGMPQSWYYPQHPQQFSSYAPAPTATSVPTGARLAKALRLPWKRQAP